MLTKTKLIKEKRSTLIRLGKILFEHKLHLAVALVLMVSANSLALVGPRLSGKAIDAIGESVGNVDFPIVYKYCFLMISVYLLSSVLSYLLSVSMIHLSQKITYKMRQSVFDHLLDLPIGYFNDTQIGDIISRISYDIDTINTSLSNDLLQIITGSITVIGSCWMMISLSWQLTLVFVVTVPISVLFARYKATKIKPLFRNRSRKLGELNGFSEEMLSGQKTIKAYNQEEEILRRFDEKNKDAMNAYFEADYQGSMIGPSVNFVNNLSLSLVSVFGALLYLASLISLGNISSFVLYSRKFSGPINETANIMSELQSAIAAAERVFKLLDEPVEQIDRQGAIELNEIQGNVCASHVCFGYDPDRTIIHDLNFEALAGKTVAIVGPTGAGKTTIINLLMRFYDVNAGKIEVDHHDIRDLTRKSLRKAYAMVLQDTWLFGGTIYENISYGSNNATYEQVVECAKAAHIHSFIEHLPQGYDTVLSDDGVNISKGQKQLLTIARAMLADANMLILDEATSNVDSHTEMQIQNAMLKLMEGKTCFVIAHRLSTIQHADLILVLKDGDIIEQGDHESLLQQNGFYASLYNSQFEN